MNQNVRIQIGALGQHVVCPAEQALKEDYVFLMKIKENLEKARKMTGWMRKKKIVLHLNL